MRNSIIIFMSLLWAIPAMSSGPAMSRILKLLETPIGRFAIEETSEGARVLELLSGRSGGINPKTSDLIAALRGNRGAMDDIATTLESRLARIEERFRSHRMRARDEMYSQVILRRIVREELTLASSSRGLKDRLLGLQKIEFVPSDSSGAYAEAEEIFLNGAKNEVLRPEEIFENLALKTESLRIGMTQFTASDSYALEMWMTNSLLTFSEATSYLNKALPVALWEAKLAQSQLPLTRVHGAAKDLMKLQKEINGIFTKLEAAQSPVLTDGMKQGLNQNSSEFRELFARIERSKL